MRLAGHQAGNGSHGQRDEGGLSETSGEVGVRYLKRPDYETPERFPLFHPGRDFRGLNLVSILEWEENNFKITLVYMCAEGHDILIGASESSKETFSLALK